MPVHSLDEILCPNSVAVVGASGDPGAGGYNFIQPLITHDFPGTIYPINPKYSEVLGLTAYSSIKEVPGPVDYVISCVPAHAVLGMIQDCREKGVKAIHVYTARFSETGRKDGIELEQEILDRARENDIRIIGPNCVGVYHPKVGLSFDHVFPKDPGPVGVISQSGGGARKLVYEAILRGIRFSKVISYGNAIDLNESDFLDYFSNDPETKIIVMYIEGVKDGKRFVSALKRTAALKPVIMIKGGRGLSGMRAIASHTASLASSTAMWETLIGQVGAVSAKTFEEAIDLAVGFASLPPIRGKRVGVAGGGGGATVLSADHCEEAGFDVVPLSQTIRDRLKEKGSPIWDWIGNPADMSIMGGSKITVGDMVELMEADPNFDFLITILRLSHRKTQWGVSAEEYLREYRLEERKLKPIITVVEERTVGIPEYDDWCRPFTLAVKQKMVDAGLPHYPSVGRAINAVKKLIDFYQRR